MSAPIPRIVLSGAVGVRDVARLAEELAAALATPDGLVIDCSGLTDIDLSIVQLLLAARRTAQAAGRSLTVRHPAGGPLQRLLMSAGFVAADGAPRGADGQYWTTAEVKAA